MKFSIRPFLSITGILVLINVLVTLYLWLQGLSLTSPKPIDLIVWGGNLGPLTLTNDPWRLFTSMFIHGGLLHLGLNMILLIQVGSLLEELIGKMRFITSYLLTGLFASLVSALWYSHQAVKASQSYQSIFLGPSYIPTVSIGASGAIMGIAATTLVCSWWKSRHPDNDSSTTHINWNSLAQVIVLNVGMGFFISGVDNACHVGGVIAGLIIGGIFLPANPLADQRLRKNNFVFVLLVGLFFLWFFYPHKNPEELIQISNDYYNELKQLQRAKDLIKNKDKTENFALKEKKKIPAGITMEAASGESYIIENGQPVDFIINSEESKAYVVNSKSNSILIINLENMQLLQTIQGPKIPDIIEADCPDDDCKGRGASSIALSKDGKWALVSAFEQNKISKVNLDSNKIEWSVDAGKYPRKIILSPNEKWAYVLNGYVNKIAIIDLEKKSIKDNPFLSDKEIVYYTYGRPINMALYKETSELFIVDTPGSQILVLDANNPGKFTRFKKMDSFAPTNIQISEEDNSLWVTGTDERGINVFKSFSIKDFSEVNDLVSCALPLGEEFALHSGKKWFAIKSPNEEKIRVASLLGLITIRVLPATPHNTLLKFSKDGSHIFALSLQGASGVLTKYDVNKTIDVESFLNNYYEALCMPTK